MYDTNQTMDAVAAYAYGSRRGFILGVAVGAMGVIYIQRHRAYERYVRSRKTTGDK